MKRGRPRKNQTEEFLPVEGKADGATYLQEFVANCTSSDFGRMIARLKNTAISGDDSPSIKASKLLLDSFMRFALEFSSMDREAKNDEERELRRSTVATLNEVMDLIEDAKKAVPAPKVVEDDDARATG